MNANQMRIELRKFYGPQWASRVDRMSEKQIVALYLKFKKEGKIK